MVNSPPGIHTIPCGLIFEEADSVVFPEEVEPLFSFETSQPKSTTNTPATQIVVLNRVIGPFSLFCVHTPFTFSNKIARSTDVNFFILCHELDFDRVKFLKGKSEHRLFAIALHFPLT